MIKHVINLLMEKHGVDAQIARNMLDDTINEIQDNPMDANEIIEENLGIPAEDMYKLIAQTE